MKTGQTVFLLIALALLSGCATFSREEIRMTSGYEKWYYPATREEWRTLWAPSDQLFFAGFVEKTCAVLDLPFSLLFDTLLWPIDYLDGNYGRPQARPKYRDKIQSNQASQDTSLRADPER